MILNLKKDKVKESVVDNIENFIKYLDNVKYNVCQLGSRYFYKEGYNKNNFNITKDTDWDFMIEFNSEFYKELLNLGFVPREIAWEDLPKRKDSKYYADKVLLLLLEMKLKDGNFVQLQVHSEGGFKFKRSIIEFFEKEGHDYPKEVRTALWNHFSLFPAGQFIEYFEKMYETAQYAFEGRSKCYDEICRIKSKENKPAEKLPI